jgi:hypothetical protein
MNNTTDPDKGGGEMMAEQKSLPELLPCPFCGSEAIKRPHDFRPSWAVECAKRKTTCPVNMRTHYGSPDDVVREWNTRSK